MRPKEYWKIPRAWKRGREIPMILCSRSCVHRSQLPLWFPTWSNSSFSPKENIGTRWALKKQTSTWVHPGKSRFTQNQHHRRHIKVSQPLIFFQFGVDWTIWKYGWNKKHCLKCVRFGAFFMMHMMYFLFFSFLCVQSRCMFFFPLLWFI